MIIDRFLKVSRNQAVTATAPSTDVIDFGQTNPNTGLHDRLDMVVTVGAAATAAGAATVQISVQDSATGSSGWADVISSGAVPIANLGAGAQIVLSMPTQHRRYVRVNYTVATGPLTGGTFSAQVVEGIQLNTPHPAA